ncbi:hypothetical protein M0802_006416 [Mischocyttarus mexicanus]|nr:hypothetical protein M0802_006416 [Mischocyttarus mexicanus]
MDVTLQKHGAKHIYRVPEGLRELCTDITREVLRSQPTEIYSFIADYMDVLLITRENAKVAVKVVNNILKGSQTIMSILYRTGLSIEQIAAAAPRIQAAFRGHHARMLLAESQGKIQWQRALMNTLNILKKSGVPAEEITKSLPTIETAYRGYYTNRNIRMQMNKRMKEKTSTDRSKSKEEKKTHGFTIGSGQTVQAVAWLEMVYEDSKLSLEFVNNAATIIQKAYKRHRIRKGFFSVQKVISSRSLIVEGILDALRQNVFDKVTSRDDIPEEFGTREDMERASKLLQQMYKDHLGHSRVSIEEEYEEEMEMEPETVEMVQLDETIEQEEEEEEEEKEQMVSSEIEDEISIEDPAGESINVESHNVMEEKIERDEQKKEIEEEEKEEQEMPHEATPTNDTAG